MRAHIERLDVDSVDWVPTATVGVSERILNVDSETGARTLLLKSLPRHKAELKDRRPQVHPVDEEFYCMSGNFTLEGDIWFGANNYVYYPPNLVHGHDVDVPGGYEIYLRNSGPISTKRVDAPRSTALHFADDADSTLPNIILRNADTALNRLRHQTLISLIPLRNAPDESDGAFILMLPKGKRIGAKTPLHSGFLEIFVISGEVDVGDRTRLSARNYSFLQHGHPNEISGIDDNSTLLVNYADSRVFNQFVQAADAIVTSDALTPRS